MARAVDSTKTATTGTVSRSQLAGLLAIVGAVLNVVFYFLARTYFASHRFGDEPTDIVAVTQLTFAVFTAVAVIAGAVATYVPRWLGHGLGAAFGVAAFGCGIAAIVRGMPGALIGALLVLGVLMPVLAYRSLRGHRADWAFLMVICGVLGVCLLFGSPKIRSLFGIPLWIAMIFPGLLGIATAALAALRGSYQTAPDAAPTTVDDRSNVAA